MNPGFGQEITSSWTGTVRVSETGLLPDARHDYRVMGTQFRGEFDIGVRTVDDGTGPFPIMPAAAYEAVAEHIVAELDVDELREQTVRHGRQEVGRCTVERVDDEAVRLDVKVFESWQEL